ncbi:protein translocase subunit SecD [Clostridium magnum]|uniref:Protein translocase subunit SecD n=1 Tax=Clostridium magnum DSM 2767 TaxID=1121326 RepID=A0A161Y659_9CLOT|nr:protein translocase subunit SecD [Clostridium magnum DSM 2767]SHI09175.1 preprotein translocase subunit SecD [Clostridium magnum DSM 2767]
MKSRVRSTILFIICVLVIGFLGYSGVYGVNAGGYRLKSFGEVINRGLDLQGGVSVLEEIQGDNVDQETINKTIELISMRVNKMGVSETVVTREGQKRIRIEIPGKFDAKEIEEGIAKTGELKFVGPDKSTILTGKDVKKASAYINPEDAQPTISLELNDQGAKKFADATQKFMGQTISITMDDQELTSPTVQAHITNGKATISGSKSLEEATRQANIINSGALPVTVKPVETKTIGASLGANALPLSILAAKVGIAIVMLFMILYYRIPGILASIALVLYIYIVLLAFASVNVTLTLSGIAGFLLTVGMAVDASILIFERMKEELKSGKSVRAAIDAGFHRAMSSVLDSNITTIIAGVVLYGLGSGAVKGFALTLIIGVALSMVTAITVTRLLIKLAAGMGWFKHKWSIGTFGVHDFRRGAK